MRHIAVTGASGAIGSVLVPKLRAAGYRVTALTRKDAPLPETQWYDTASPPAALIHLAAASQARQTEPATAQAQPHLDFLNQLTERGWRGHLVFLSSAAVYGGRDTPIPETQAPAPPNPYGAAKLAVETGFTNLATSLPLPLSLLRAANIYGTAQDLARRRVTGLLIDAARKALPFTLYGDGSSQRDYLHVDDLCRAILAVLSLPPPAATPRLLNLGSGSGTSLAALIALVEAATRQTIPRLYAPPQAEAAITVLDTSRARAALGWAPRISLSEGLRRLAAELPGEPYPLHRIENLSGSLR